jgi:hypothetical protein
MSFETRSPFINFENMKMLFSFLKVKIYPQKIRLLSVKWKITKV